MGAPSNASSLYPTNNATNVHSNNPTNIPTYSPTFSPTIYPTNIPTTNPTIIPSGNIKYKLYNGNEENIIEYLAYKIPYSTIPYSVNDDIKTFGSEKSFSVALVK